MRYVQSIRRNLLFPPPPRPSFPLPARVFPAPTTVNNKKSHINEPSMDNKKKRERDDQIVQRISTTVFSPLSITVSRILAMLWNHTIIIGRWKLTVFVYVRDTNRSSSKVRIPCSNVCLDNNNNTKDKVERTYWCFSIKTATEYCIFFYYKRIDTHTHR